MWRIWYLIKEMRLKFILDDNYVVAHTLSYTGYGNFSSDENRETLEKFSQYAWEYCGRCYALFAGRLINKTMIEAGSEKAVEELNHSAKHLPEYLNNLKSSSSYKELREQVGKYKDYCETEWKNTFPKAKEIVKHLTQLDLNKSFEVYITHPSLRNGRYWGDNKISWGCKEKWPHYSSVYLWHEILHSYFSHSQVEHTVIELIADVEIRFQLNNEKHPPFKEGKGLDKLKSEILPQWEEYKVDGGDIMQFIKDVRGSLEKNK